MKNNPSKIETLCPICLRPLRPVLDGVLWCDHCDHSEAWVCAADDPQSAGFQWREEQDARALQYPA